MRFKVVLYPKNRIFCVQGRFFENVINRLFNHPFALFQGVFDQKKSFGRKICRKLIICPIFGHSNAPNNDCLQLLVQNLEETVLPLGPLSRGNDLVALIVFTAGHIFRTDKNFWLSIDKRVIRFSSSKISALFCGFKKSLDIRWLELAIEPVNVSSTEISTLREVLNRRKSKNLSTKMLLSSLPQKGRSKPSLRLKKKKKK